MRRDSDVSEGSILAESGAKTAAVQGTLKERPFPRLLQQLHRKQFTGYVVVADQTGDESEIFMREGSPVHVGRPVDTDRLDNLLVEYGVVPPDIVAAASAQVASGLRLGDVLERMGALDKQKLAQVLKSQVVRKLTRLFFVVEGTYAIYMAPHAYGEGADFALMRVDPRSVVYPGIRAAYDLPRVTRELSHLIGQRFRLRELSPGFIAAMGVAPEDATIEALCTGWMTLDDLDTVTSRPFEVRSIVLTMYYADLLDREVLDRTRQGVEGSVVPQALMPAQSSDASATFKLLEDSGPKLQSAVPPAPATGSARGEAANGPRVASPPPPAAPPPSDERPPVDAPGARPSRTIPAADAPPAASAAPSVVVVGAAKAASGRPAVSSPRIPVVRTPFVSTVRAEAKSAPEASVKVAGAARSGPASTPESVRASIQEMAQKLGKVTHFELLGVSQKASPNEVGTAFVRAARQFHPDRLASAGLQDLQPLAEKILAHINEAAMVLGDATRRAEYVATLAPGSSAANTSLPALLEAENMFLKGEVFLKKGEHAKAVECFTTACQGNPGEPQYRAYLAWARFDDPRTRKETLVRETLKDIEEVLGERPKFSRGFYWVGLLWKFLNESDKAERAFREAVTIDPSFIDASRELRLVEMRKGKQSSGKPAPKSDPPRGGGLMGKFFKR
jgi:hypothetical protein